MPFTPVELCMTEHLVTSLVCTASRVLMSGCKVGQSRTQRHLLGLNHLHPWYAPVLAPDLQLNRIRAEEFYGEHKGKPFFPNLVNFMTSGPIWALVLAKPGAILAWRALMGPTNVFTARAEKPKW